MSEPGPTQPLKVWRLARRVFGYLRNYRLLFASTILVMLALSAVDRARVILIKPLFDRLSKTEISATCAGCGQKTLAEKAEDLRHCARCGAPVAPGDPEKDLWRQLYFLAYVGLGLSLAIFPIKYAKEYFCNSLAQRVLMDLRNDLSAHLLRLPLRFFHDRRSGDMLSRLTNDSILMQQCVGFLFEDLFLQPFLMLTAIGLVMAANWQLGLLAVVFFPLYALPLIKIGKAMRRVRKKSLERLGDITESIMQMYSGIRIVKSFNMEKEEDREFRETNLGFFRKVMSMVRKKALVESLVDVFISIGIALLISLAGFAFLKQEMTPGAMALFFIGIAMINTPVKELTKGYSRLQESMAGAERIFEIMDAPPDPPDAPDAIDLGTVEGVEYRGVSFAYNATPVLQDINLSARPGEVVALVGRSGSGKSTLVDLLSRLYDPQKGAISLSGHDLRMVKRSSLLSHIAVVAQDTFLFNATVGENIRYGHRGASDDEVRAAAKAAHIHDFIAGLEKGYDTVVGERGAKLSGGQRQRIAIARAVLKNPSILILDEATSALDAESEQAVQEALEILIHSGRRITLVVAHRLSTVKDADRIVVLDGGRIVEEGRHDALLARGGVYASLYRTLS